MKNKKAVSAIVATVLLVLITVTSSAVVWQAIIPLVNKALQMNQACLNARLSIDTRSGYSCYDENKKQVNVMVLRGGEDFQLAGMQLGLSGEGKMVEMDTRKPWTAKPKGDIKILIIGDCKTNGCGTPLSYRNEFESRLTSLGYNLITDVTVTTIGEVAAYAPDIVACFRYSWSCNSKSSLFNNLYYAGYSVYTVGNDNGNLLLPIAWNVSTSANAPLIYPDKITNNYISRGWDSAQGSDTDSRQGITRANQSAQVVAIDTANNFIEAIYLEEEGRGRWFNYQPDHTAPNKLITNAIEYLTREETMKVYQQPGRDIYLPQMNEETTYNLNMTSYGLNKVTEVSVAPIVKVGTSERVCSITHKTKVPECA